MGDMMNSFILSGSSNQSGYYLKNTSPQEVAQASEQKPVAKTEQLPEQEIIQKRRKNGGCAKAISSSIIPGTGQLFDGRFAPAAVYFITPIAFFLGLKESAKNFAINGGEFAINKLKHWFTDGIEKARQDIKFTEKETFRNLYKSAGEKCLKNAAKMCFFGFAIPVVYGMNIMDAYKGKRVKEISKSKNNQDKQKLTKAEKNMISVVGLSSLLVAGIALAMNIRKGKTGNLSTLPILVK